MASDRVFIRCSGCGAWKMLMKHSTGAFSTQDNGILDWLDAHGLCHPNLYNNDLGGNPGFTLHTEDDVGGALSFDKQNADPPITEPTQPVS
jgi:hypothetical protein